jgi:hypothetical protein
MRNWFRSSVVMAGAFWLANWAALGVTITKQPVQPPVPVQLGTAIRLEVTAEGKGVVRFQWQRNGVNILGATKEVLVIPEYRFIDGGVYAVVVRDDEGAQRSLPVDLFGGGKPLPFTDQFFLPSPTAPNVIAGQNGFGSGQNFGATIQRPPEPFHAGVIGGASMWLQWTAPITGVATLATHGSDFNTVLAVYLPPNPDQPGSDFQQVAANNDEGRFHTSLVEFNAQEGRTYLIAVDGVGAKAPGPSQFPTAGRGHIQFSWRLEPANVLIPGVLAEPPDSNGLEDEPVTMGVSFEAFGDVTAEIQWFRNDQPVRDATGGLLKIDRLTPAEVGRHFARIVVFDAAGERRTNYSRVVDVQIRRRSAAGDSQVFARDSYSRSLADVQTPGPGAAVRAGASRPRPVSLARGVSGTQVFNTTTSTSEPGEPIICGVGGGASEWYSILAAESGVIVATTLGSNFDTVLGAYFDTGEGEGLFDGLNELACNNDSGALPTSRVAFAAAAGTIYSLAVDGAAGASGIALLNYEMFAPLAPATVPASRSAIAGELVQFSVSATGYGPYTYQWRKNTLPITGETGPTLTLNGVTTDDAGDYSVIVGNDVGESFTTTAATLTVLVPPAITTQPTDLTVNQGANALFSITATGDAPLAYQWFKGETLLGGQTAASLTLNSVGTADAGSYLCLVTNVAGSITSAPAVLTVIVPPAITTPPANQTANQGAAASFTVVASGTEPLSYQWRKGVSDLPGKTSATLNLSNVLSSDEGSYSCVVSNAAGSVESAAATLTVIIPPTITTPPANQTVNQGSAASFTVLASGTAPLSYQWRKGVSNLPGKTSATLNLSNVQASDEGSYSCVVSNAAGSVESVAATLTVIVPPAITIPPANQTVNQGSAASFTVLASGTAPLSYQWRKGVSDLPGKTAATLNLSNVQSSDEGSYTCVVSNAAGSVESGAATLTVIVPPAIATPPANQTANQGAGASFTVIASGTAPLTYQWRKGVSDLPGKTSATLNLSNIQSSDEGSYSCVVSNAAGSVESAAATLTVIVPPAITTQPANQTANQGAAASFTVVASGTGPLTYQWRKGVSDLPGKTSATLNLSNVQPSDEGSYTCVVINAAGSVESAPATLTIIVPPTITTEPVSLSVIRGGSAEFTVMASGTGPLSYQWRKGVSDLPGKTSATLSLSNVQSSDEGSYTCRVSNAAGSDESLAATLTVTVPAAPVLTGEVLGDGRFRVHLTGQAGVMYSIQTSVNYSAWTEVLSGSSGSGQLEYTTPVPVTDLLQLFRAQGP